MQLPWYRRLWNSWKIVVKLIGYVAIAALPILGFAILSVLLWTLMLGPAIQSAIDGSSITTEQKEYLVFALGQLADWSWRILLLGAFAALVYEQIKRQEELYSKCEAILVQVRQLVSTQNWNLLDELYEEFIKLGSEAQCQELRREMAVAFYSRVVNPNTANWNTAYESAAAKGWLPIAHKLDPENESVKLLLEFSHNINDKSENGPLKALACIEMLEPPLLPHFMFYHKTVIRNSIAAMSHLRAKLVEIIESKNPPHQYYLLRTILDESPRLDNLTEKFLDESLIDKELFRGGVLEGTAELEPDNLVNFRFNEAASPSETKPSLIFCVTDLVKPALEPKHLFVVGEQGNGKTFLNRQLEFWTRKMNPRWILVNWTRFIPLFEDGQKSIPLLLGSFVRELRETLEHDQERFQELFQISSWKPEMDWREQLLNLKEMLRVQDIKGIYISIDNLDKYPEFRRDNRLLELLIVSLLRPEFIQQEPRCYLRLYIERSIHQTINTARPPWSIFESLELKWTEPQMKEILRRRIQAIQKLDGAAITEQELTSMHKNARSARDLILQLNRYFEEEKRKYNEFLDKWA